MNLTYTRHGSHVFGEKEFQWPANKQEKTNFNCRIQQLFQNALYKNKKKERGSKKQNQNEKKWE